MANLVRRVSQSAEQIIQSLEYINPRKSQSNNISNTEIDKQIDGSNIKSISNPTKSFLVKRTGTHEQQLQQVEIELKHAHMQLMAERGKVRELESTLKGVVDKKYKKDTNIISQLQQSQNKLREQLGLVIQSKMDLCESTAQEIERLRRIIQILMSNLYKLTGKETVLPDINKFFITNYDNDKISSSNSPKYNNNDYNKTRKSNINEDKTNLDNFPHNNESRIDLRTLEDGDGKTFAEPFASVDLKYTGFIYHRNTNEWEKFTNDEISNTIFETKLGNNENIIGLEQAVLSMTKGEIAQVYVPSRLAYGIHGAHPLIPPNADLIFKLTLVEIHNENNINNIENDDEDTENDDDNMEDINNYNNNNIINNQQPNNNDMNDVYNNNDDLYPNHKNDDINNHDNLDENDEYVSDGAQGFQDL